MAEKFTRYLKLALGQTRSVQPYFVARSQKLFGCLFGWLVGFFNLSGKHHVTWECFLETIYWVGRWHESLVSK